MLLCFLWKQTTLINTAEFIHLYYPKHCNEHLRMGVGIWAGNILFLSTAAAAKSLQLCPTLCDPIDGSPPVSPTPGILQARTLEWVAISFSNAWKWKVKVKSLSRVQLLAIPWTAAYQAPPSMGFSRQEYWSGVPFPSPVLICKATKMMFICLLFMLRFSWVMLFIYFS